MLIQKELEAKIVTAISSALSAASVSGVDVAGAWRTSQAGLVRWIDGADADSPAYVSVSVACPSWQTFTTPVVDFAVTLTLFVRPEIDATGAKLAAVAEVVETILRGWQTNASASWTALDLTELSTDGIRIDGGTAPTLTEGICSVAWNFTLTGSYREPQPQTNQ